MQEGMQGKVLLVGWAELWEATLGVEPHIRSKGTQTLPILSIAVGQLLPALFRGQALTNASLQCGGEALKVAPTPWGQV